MSNVYTNSSTSNINSVICSRVSLCWWSLFCLFSGALCTPFSPCSLLNIRRFTYAFSCFLWLLCLFLSSLFSLKTLSPWTWILTMSFDWQSFSSAGIVAFCWLKIAKHWELLFNYNLTNLISRSKCMLQIICPRSLTSTSPNCMPAIYCTKAWHSSMRTSLWSAGVSWCTLMEYPSYACNRTCALPSPLPFHYVMANIVPEMQLAMHAKSSTLYKRLYGVKSKFFSLMGYYYFV